MADTLFGDSRGLGSSGSAGAEACAFAMPVAALSASIISDVAAGQLCIVAVRDSKGVGGRNDMRSWAVRVGEVD